MASLALPTQKQKKKEEATALLEAARKSVPDERGRVRCLSCGAVFVHHEALAAHLVKHGGINDLRFTPSNIVATSHNVFRRRPIERPTLSLHEAVAHAAQRPREKTKHKKASNGSHGSQSRKPTRRSVSIHGDRSQTMDDGRSKNAKASRTKRSILIRQVLALNQKLVTYRRQLDILQMKTDPSPPEEGTKRQMKKVQGCINAAETELHMALTAINRKFTFRQLVMIEYLTGQLDEWIASSERSPDLPAVDVVDAETIDENDLQLYDEADVLFVELESVREAPASESSTRWIRSRRDSETGKLYIAKPTFIESTATKISESTDTLQIVGEAEGEATEIDCKDDDDDVPTVDHSSSDDDMWGFSNVLVEWAHAAKHKKQTSFPSVPPLGDILFRTDFEKASSDGDDLEAKATVDRATVRVMHIGKTAAGGVDKRSMLADVSDRDMGWSPTPEAVRRGDGGRTAGGREGTKTGCVFIKPHLGISIEETAASSGDSKDGCNRRRKASVARSGMSGRSSSNRSENDKTDPGTTEAKTLDEAVHVLLTRLNAKQHDHMKSGKGRHRWMMSGLSEVRKQLTRGTVRLLIIARNLDAAVQVQVSEIESVAKDANIPIVYALSRRKIGQIYHPRKRMSMVAVLDVQEMEDAFSAVIQMGHEQS